VHRRALLVALGSSALAGCVARPPGDDPEPTEPASSTSTGVPGVGIDAAPGDCPASHGTVVCTPTAHDDAPVVLSPSPASPALPGAITFELTNGTSRPFVSNFYGWTLHKRVDGEWFRIAPVRWKQPVHRLPAGETHRWETTLRGLPDHPVPVADGDERVTLEGVGGGRYVFAIDGHFDGQDGRYSFAAPFDVEGPPLELRPTDRVRDVVVEGESVTGRLDTRGDREAVYTLRRVEDDPSARRLVAERLVRGDHAYLPRRDAVALSLEHDAARVELRGPSGSHPPFGVDEEGERFRHGGITWAASARPARDA
jgi:hypothetical protein